MYRMRSELYAYTAVVPSKQFPELLFLNISTFCLLKDHITMVSTKKLIRLAAKWQKLIATNRRRVSWPRKVADKGHFVVYTTDGRRFMIPLSYLKSEVFRELLRMAEEEFGMRSDGPITLPFDSTFMEYTVFIMSHHSTAELQGVIFRACS